MAAYLGSGTFNNVYLGNTQVDSLWLGSTKFWPIVAPTSSWVGTVSGSYGSGPVSTLVSIFNARGGTAASASGGPSYVELFCTGSYTLNYGPSEADGWIVFVDSGSCVKLGTSPGSGFGGCSTIQKISLNACKSVVAVSLASNPVMTIVELPALSGSTALGGSTGNDGVFGGTFGNASAISGSLTVPSFYSSSNAGAPDGDIQYLLGRGWTINYV